MKKIKRLAGALLAFSLSAALLSGCGGKKDANAITIYDGQFAEMQILHQMVKMLVETHTDAKVVIKEEMSPVNSFNELVRGGADLMNGYDGTLLTTYLKMDVSDVPEGESIYDFANRVSIEEKGVRMLDPIGINNTYAIAVPEAVAAQHNLQTISDLVPVAEELVFGAEHEFFSEEGSMKFYPFADFYGLKFKEAKPVDLGLKYAAVESGNLDVTVVYATDGLNKKAGLQILTDDRGYFPEYNGALLVRSDLFERFADIAPNLEEVLAMLAGVMTDADMVDMSYAVDVEGQSVPEVAQAFLENHGLLT